MMTSITFTNSAQLICLSNRRTKQEPGAAAIRMAAPGSFPAFSFDRPWINGSVRGAVPAVLGLKHDKMIYKATQSAVNPNDDSRPLANFHPNIWGDRFLLSDLEHDQLIKSGKELSLKVGNLTQELKTMLKETDQCHMKQLELVDNIQRLGIDYHFEKEINRTLQDMYDNYLDFHKSNNDLYSNALGFRLLRQHGYNVSCDVFEKFKNDKGEFKASITSDVMGMLEFYEATFLSMEGEDVLDHGRAFTSAHLRSVLPNLNNSTIRKRVFKALDHSNRRGFPRLETRNYISICQEHALCHENLLTLAKLDFNLLQNIHKRELSELYSWWKGLDAPKNFFYARDRCVEIYFCTLGVYFEPQYDVARKYTSRLGLLFSILDDTYDAYGTFEELLTFTEAIESWNIPYSSSSLPRSMEVLYKALFEVVEDIEDEMVDGKQRASYAKEVIKGAARAFFEEVKWREKKFRPATTEEYMSMATKSIFAFGAIIISYIGMGDIVPNELFHWLLTSPVELKAGAIFGRLRDDIAGHEFEKEREHIPSVVECYAEEHGVSQEQAIDDLNAQMEIAWKDFNGKLLMLTNFPAAVLQRALNLFRVVEVVYKKGDFYTHVGEEMQSYVKQLLIDPVTK